MVVAVRPWLFPTCGVGRANTPALLCAMSSRPVPFHDGGDDRRHLVLVADVECDGLRDAARRIDHVEGLLEAFRAAPCGDDGGPSRPMPLPASVTRATFSANRAVISDAPVGRGRVGPSVDGLDERPVAPGVTAGLSVGLETLCAGRHEETVPCRFTWRAGVEGRRRWPPSSQVRRSST